MSGYGSGRLAGYGAVLDILKTVETVLVNASFGD